MFKCCIVTSLLEIKKSVYQHQSRAVNLCKFLYNTHMNTELIERIRSIFQGKFGSAPAHVARAPGRVNLLGEHVDYNEGFVLPAAIDRAVWLAFSPEETDQTTLAALDLAEDVSFTSKTLSKKTDATGRLLPTWALYPAGVMWALKEAG